MVQSGFGGLDTPRTNVGDATYLRQPDFDISQEASFQSPSKEANVFQQTRNGGRPNLRTPRGSSRAPFTDRRNLPAGMGGAEFTPLLKSATRNSSRRYGGKENGPATPAFLDKIDEDMTPVPGIDLSSYGASRNASSFMANTPMGQVDSSSLSPTPLVSKINGNGAGPLQDGNQLSLREQENVIDRIEKENFGLKLKIHFLEEALRKAGPGFNEAALKENTDLKVDKVTMQRELQRYKKHLTSAEKDLENYRREITEMHERAKRKVADDSLRAEMEGLRKELEEKERKVEDMQRQLDQDQQDADKIERLQDEISDLEAEVRDKDRIISQHEDEAEDLKLRAELAEEKMKGVQRRVVELEEKAQSSEKLEEAKEIIEDLEADVRRLEQQVDDMKDKLEEADSEKERAEGDLEELQDEMANKSLVTKGLSRQVEEKVARLQGELDSARQEYSRTEQQHDARQREAEELKFKLKESRQARDSAERESRSLAAKLEEAQAELNTTRDQKALLQTRHDALTNESTSLQRDISRLQRTVTDLEEDLKQERQHASDLERDIRSQYDVRIGRLNDEISHLQAEIREKEDLYDGDGERWETERHNLTAERDRAEERAANLQKAVDRLRQAEGALTSTETKLQDALKSETERHKSEEEILSRQIQGLQRDLEVRQGALENARNNLSAVRDELGQAQLDYQAQKDKVGGLEDEVEVLQVALEEESERARQNQELAQKECDDLKKQLTALREAANNAQASTAASQETARRLDRLNSQLAESAAHLARVTKERQALQDQLAKTNIDLHATRASLAETKAERDEIEGQLRRAERQEDDTFRLDQERIDLRTAKMKLDGEVRRLREENKSLSDQRIAMEKSLEDEIEKAAVEEERLGHEIRQLQAKVRQSAETQDLAAARRTVRELERRIEDYKSQLAATAALPASAEGNSEMSIVRRDLSDARARAGEYLQREAAHKDAIKSLKRQIADLERDAHHAEMDRLAASPVSELDSGRRTEVSELRHRLSVAQQSIHDLKKSARDSERQGSSALRDLQARLDEMEERKAALEQALEDVKVAADEAAEAHEAAAHKHKAKLDRCKRERDNMAKALAEAQNHTGGSDMSRETRKDLHDMLRKSQVEADALQREVREHKEAVAELMQLEESLRKKLDKARSERATYRADVERLQREVGTLQATRMDVMGSSSAVVLHGNGAAQMMSGANGAGPDASTLIRATEEQRLRHQKEIRCMEMYIGWMQASLERETTLRSDVAYAKRKVREELELRVAWYVLSRPLCEERARVQY